MNSSIRKAIHTLQDQAADLEKAVDLLYSLQQNKGPLVELATVLKTEKPVLYNLLKSRVKNPGLSMLFRLTMDYEQARAVVDGTVVKNT